MDTTTSGPPSVLSAYRPAVYRCLTRARAALFDLCAALATDPSAHSFVEVSQAPCFQRRGPSVYEALEDGRCARPALRTLFRDTAPSPVPGARRVWALDSSPRVRPYARTVPDRTLGQVPAAGQVRSPHTAPVRPGGAFSPLVVLPPEPSSWTPILDNARSPSDQTALTVGAAQLAAFVPTRKAHAGTDTGTDPTDPTDPTPDGPDEGADEGSGG